MIESTFVLLKGIGPCTERRLWERGIRDWRAFLGAERLPGITPERKSLYDELLAQAVCQLEGGHSRFFRRHLKPRDHWRLFQAFRPDVLYLDIETTGGPPEFGEVTVVGLYRRGEMISLVRGKDLTEDRLNEEFARSGLLVTFFGSVFDLPYLRAKFPGLRYDHPHFDLCFACRRLGLEGGLKRVETTLGIERDADLHGLDGWDAVRLWNGWCEGNLPALQQLVRYNASDTMNLEPLAVELFNRLVDRYGPRPEGGFSDSGTRSSHVS